MQMVLSQENIGTWVFGGVKIKLGSVYIGKYKTGQPVLEYTFCDRSLFIESIAKCNAYLFETSITNK